MGDSLWAEELTFMEVRDKIRAGTTAIIIGTGGVEQNGPYVAGAVRLTCSPHAAPIRNSVAMCLASVFGLGELRST